MHSRHSIWRCSRRSGRELSDQEATRNTRSAEDLVYACFLHLPAGRLNLSLLLPSDRLRMRRGARAPHFKRVILAPGTGNTRSVTVDAHESATLPLPLLPSLQST